MCVCVCEDRHNEYCGGRGSVCVCVCEDVVPWWCSGKHSVLPSHRLVVQTPPGVKGVCHSLHTLCCE